MTDPLDIFGDGRAVLYEGDCLAVLPTLATASVDAIVTDPPYGLEFMGKDWDAPWKYGMSPFAFKDGAHRTGVPSFTSTRNPMCRKCHKHKRGSKRHVACSCETPDFDDVQHRVSDMAKYQSWCERWAREALRVAKPGAHLLAFGGTRTFHRLACAIEDAGWEIRDTVMWVYGSGFPKSLDVSKAIDKEAGAERPKLPGGGVGTDEGYQGGFEPGKHRSGEPITAAAAAAWQGWGTALKPAWEPIIVARKSLEGTVAENVQRHGTGGLNIDGCRVGAVVETWPASRRHHGGTFGQCAGWPGETQKTGDAPLGRWPANLIHDGSEEVVGLFPQTETHPGVNRKYAGGSMFGLGGVGESPASNGSAARFFYTAKASSRERWFYCHDCGGTYPMAERDAHGHGHVDAAGKQTWNHTVSHPTQKPESLMRYLCRLITPPGGIVLDPFAGSGSTGKAAALEGFRFIGIEIDPEYLAIAAARIRAAAAATAVLAKEADAPLFPEAINWLEGVSPSGFCPWGS